MRLINSHIIIIIIIIILIYAAIFLREKWINWFSLPVNNKVFSSHYCLKICCVYFNCCFAALILILLQFSLYSCAVVSLKLQHSRCASNIWFAFWRWTKADSALCLCLPAFLDEVIRYEPSLRLLVNTILQYYSFRCIEVLLLLHDTPRDLVNRCAV